MKTKPDPAPASKKTTARVMRPRRTAKSEPEAEAPAAPVVRRTYNRRKKIEVPPILLEGDQPAPPPASGPGQKYALGPALLAGPALSQDVTRLRALLEALEEKGRVLSVLDRALFHLDNAYYIPAVEVSGRVAKTHLHPDHLVIVDAGDQSKAK